MWWMPTTHEFGPRGAYGDWERHDKLATRFGFSSTHSPEQRLPDANGKPKNTTLRLADSLNVFDTGSLAPGVTGGDDTLNVSAPAPLGRAARLTGAPPTGARVDAGMKSRGSFLQPESSRGGSMT